MVHVSLLHQDKLESLLNVAQILIALLAKYAPLVNVGPALLILNVVRVSSAIMVYVHLSVLLLLSVLQQIRQHHFAMKEVYVENVPLVLIARPLDNIVGITAHLVHVLVLLDLSLFLNVQANQHV
jgi:hypothetical protein